MDLQPSVYINPHGDSEKDFNDYDEFVSSRVEFPTAIIARSGDAIDGIQLVYGSRRLAFHGNKNRGRESSFQLQGESLLKPRFREETPYAVSLADSHRPKILKGNPWKPFCFPASGPIPSHARRPRTIRLPLSERHG